MNLPLVFAYETLREELAHRLVGTRLRVADWLPGAAIAIRRLHLYPSGSRLVVGVEFETLGLMDWLSAQGSVYLAGTPVFDNESKQLTVPDLQFTRRTGNALFDFGSYLFADSLRDLLRENAIFDVKDTYAKILDEANAAFNRNYGKGVSLRGKLERLSIADIRVRRDDLIVLIQAEGRVEAFTVGAEGS